MGLLTLPFRGLLRVFEEVAERAEDELWNEDAIRDELTALYRGFECGELSEDEFTRREADCVRRLQDAEAHNRGRRAHR